MTEDPNEKLRRDFARYVVSPGLLDDLKVQRRQRDKRQDRRGLVSDGGHEESRVKATRPAEPTARVIIELNPDYEGGLPAAKDATLAILSGLGVRGARAPDAQLSRYFIFAELELAELQALAGRAAPRPYYKVWEDQPLRPLLHRSVRTIKGDACLTAFGADGQDVVVAVADSGIDGTHPHFAAHANLDLPTGIQHRDFVGVGDPLVDEFGHGTHVAGIIAGRTCASETKAIRLGEARDAGNSVVTVAEPMDKIIIQGVAPKAKLVSLKVLKGSGQGYASALIAALEYVQEVNDNGRRLKIHCVNLSLGYPFDAAWFAAGHSPLCAVVDRVSSSGVVVVAAAGNDGSAMVQTEGRTNRQRIAIQAINDPGNAQEAITVGATHAEAPHKYGISYFSSRGPTADGRLKPDLVAPGERILSCAASGSEKLAMALEEAEVSIEAGVAYFREESGTSMAAPHVSGAVAALLSVRGEFIGRPEAVKEIFMRSCTDLHRSTDFQGAGLIDLMRAIQSV